MNAIHILHDDHQKFLNYFAEIAEASTADKQKLNSLFKELEEIIDAHMDSEEEIFYPEVMQVEEVRQMIEKSYQSHHFVKLALKELHLIPYAFDSWKPKFLAIRDMIIQHMNEEEQWLFPKIQQQFPEERLQTIGKKILAKRIKS